MSPLPTIRAIVHKACPELLELKFGCEVNTNFTHLCNPAPFNPDGRPLTVHLKGRKIVKSQKNLAIGKIGCYLTYVFDDGEAVEQYSESRKPYDMEIIGSPIGLAEILRTYYASICLDEDIHQDYREEARKLDYLEGAKEILAIWDLTQPLDGQSEETLQKLLKILQ